MLGTEVAKVANSPGVGKGAGALKADVVIEEASTVDSISRRRILLPCGAKAGDTSFQAVNEDSGEG